MHDLWTVRYLEHLVRVACGVWRIVGSQLAPVSFCLGCSVAYSIYSIEGCYTCYIVYYTIYSYNIVLHSVLDANFSI